MLGEVGLLGAARHSLLTQILVPAPRNLTVLQKRPDKSAIDSSRRQGGAVARRGASQRPGVSAAGKVWNWRNSLESENQADLVFNPTVDFRTVWP